MEPSRWPRLIVLIVGLAIVLASCAQAIPGNPVVSPRVKAAAELYRACRDAVATTISSLDALLDATDRSPSGSSVDVEGIGRFFDGMRRNLNGGCGYWPEQSGPQSDVVIHLSEQAPTRSPLARTAISSMIGSICGAVEGPLDQHGVNLTPKAHQVCLVR